MCTSLARKRAAHLWLSSTWVLAGHAWCGSVVEVWHVRSHQQDLGQARQRLRVPGQVSGFAVRGMPAGQGVACDVNVM